MAGASALCCLPGHSATDASYARSNLENLVHPLLKILAALIPILLLGTPAPARAAAPTKAQSPAGAPAPASVRRAVFAGGCFWCVEAAYEGTPGVVDVVSGYAGGSLANPSYERVSAGGTGHFEVVQVTYDPARIDYARLLDIYWRNVDPFDAGGQFCDRGESYRAAIFVDGAAERQLAETSKASLARRFGKPIATRVIDAAPFYAAEDYHQDYHVRNPLRYKYYSTSCGRAARLESIWGKAEKLR
ncbi:MAG: peptide-methionine (S)-S-oxide reductase MsrA [Burkholderiales bacterium]|nr:peptide-methionine (S)-S-oxide reductase MsrA [Burkholderiales bacterium]